MKAFRLNNLTGGINTLSEDNALVVFPTSLNPAAQCEFRDIENFYPRHRGGMSKHFGYTLHKDTGSDPIRGVGRFRQADGNSHFMYGAGGSVYTLAAGVATDIGATVDSGSFLHFETANDRFVICDGVNAAQFWDGATATGIAGGAPAAPVMSLYHANRLWLFDGGYIYYSNPLDITAGYSANFIPCGLNDGQEITSIKAFFIPDTLEPVIIVGKRNSVGIISGDGSDVNPFTYIPIHFSGGVQGFRQIVQFGQNVAYLTKDGVASYTTGNSQQKLYSEFLSNKVRYDFSRFNQSVLPDAHMWHDEKYSRISLAVAEGTYTYPSVIWHYDYRLNAWYKQRLPYQAYILCAFVDPEDGVFYHGDELGNIFVHGESYNSYNGAAINAYFTLPYIDFGTPQFHKQIKKATVGARSQGSYNLGVGWRFDYGKREGTTNTVGFNAGNYIWGGGVWTDNPDVYQWGAAPLLFNSFYPSGWFRSAQPTFTQSGAGQPIDVFEIEFLVEQMEMR